MTLRLTKRGIRVLTARYRAVLLAAIMGTFFAANAMAADVIASLDDYTSGITAGTTVIGTVDLSGKQDVLTTTQQSAVDSGITSALVGKITTNETNINTINTNIGLINTKLTDVYNKTETNNAISAATTGMLTTSNYAATLDSAYAKTGDLANYVKTDLSNLTDAQKGAINSGITADKVSTYDGYATAIAAKADKATTLAGYGITDAYTKTEVDTAVNAKADKATTLAGYGITDAYTKTETDNAISTATTLTTAGKNYAANDTALQAIAKLDTVIGDASSGLTKAVADLTTDPTTGAIAVKGAQVGTDGLSVAGNLVATNGIQAGASNAFTVSNAGAITNVAGITSQGDITSTGNISTTNGKISGKTGEFSGALTSDTLTVNNAATLQGNATVGGTFGVTGKTTLSGDLAGTTATFTGAVTTGALKSEGLDAGSGLIKTTGALQAGAATVSSLDAGSGTIKTSGAVEAGTLAVSGTSTFTGLATFGTAGFNLGGNTVTAIETAAVAAGAGKTDTLATTATVLASAENGTYSGTKVKGDTASATLGAALDKGLTALNNVLIADGSKVDDAKVEVSWNSTNSTLETVLGNGVYSSTNQLTAGDSVTTALSALDKAVGNTTFSGKNAGTATDLTVAVNSLDTAIGDRSTLSATNGNLTAGSDIVTALNALDGTLGNVKALDGTTGAQTGNLAAAGSTVADHLTAIDNRLGQIHGLVANATDTTTTTGKAYAGNLAVGTTVEEHLEALDASIGDRRNYTNPHNIANGQTVAASLNALDTVIGDFGGVTNANGNIGADIATSLDNMDAAIGTRNYTSTKYVTAGDDLTTAVSSLDENLERVENRVNGLEDRTQKMNREMKAGFASLAAMSALVPNARSAGDTQVSLGTGYYRGTAGFALGAFHHFNDNVMMNVGAGYSAHGAGTFRAGVTFGF